MPVTRTLMLAVATTLAALCSLAPAASAASTLRTPVKAYFMQPGDRLVPVQRVPLTSTGPATASVRALLAGPTGLERSQGYTTVIPRGTIMRSISVSGDVATVDLSWQFARDVQLESKTMRQRLAQVVYTVTQFNNINGARIRVEGKPVRSEPVVVTTTREYVFKRGDPNLTGAGGTTTPPNLGAQPTDPTTGTPVAGAGTITVKNYYVQNGVLIRVARTVTDDGLPIRASLGQLFLGPTARERSASIVSHVPAGVQMRVRPTISGRVLNVDLTSNFAEGGDMFSQRARLAQLVYTCTQLGNVDSVRLYLDGDQVTVFGSSGLLIDAPLGRADVWS
jgi:spore germination protein GerM